MQHRIVAYDFGMKRNILRRLRQEGFRVQVVPAERPADEVLAMKPDGVFLSNGPGDPAALDYVHRNIRGLMGKTPIFGICLGHQMLGYALGGKTFKLKFGHRGGNQPVKDLQHRQGHHHLAKPRLRGRSRFAPAGGGGDAYQSERRNRGRAAAPRVPVFSVQYHPEAAPGPNDASYFFQQFGKLIEDSR